MEIRLLPEAEADLDDVWLYVAKVSNSIEIANRFVNRITDQLGLIGRQPQIGRSRTEDLGIGMRSFPLGEYIILYRLEDEAVLVRRVLRGSRNIEGIMNE